MLNFQIDGKNDKRALTFSFFMLEKSYLHQNGVELNFLFIEMASGHAISLRINPRIREDSKGVPGTRGGPGGHDRTLAVKSIKNT